MFSLGDAFLFRYFFLLVFFIFFLLANKLLEVGLNISVPNETLQTFCSYYIPSFNTQCFLLNTNRALKLQEHSTMQKYRFTSVYMSATISFSLLKFGACKAMENPSTLSFTLLIKSVHLRSLECQFWIALNCFAVTFTNSTGLCTLLALESNF